MEVILDTSFILTCLKEKIDFLEAENFGKLLLPLQVLEEFDKLEERGGREGRLAELASEIIERNKDKFKIIDLGEKYVDSGIKSYVKNRKNIIVATLDKELKNSLKRKTRFLVIRARKKLAVE